MTHSTQVAVSQRIPFPGLAATAFQHPLDRQATENLKKVKGFDYLVAKFVEYGIERQHYVMNMGNSIRIGPRQLPHIHRMLQECCTILDVPEPELYVSEGEVNAYTYGHNHPYIVLQSGLIEALSDEEIVCVLAHELGHIKCGHVLYHQMAKFMTPFLSLVPHAGQLIGRGMQAALLLWSRRAEYSADRAGLLAVQDARLCLKVLMKLASGPSRWQNQLNLDVFLDQARAYHDSLEQSKIDKFYHFMVGFNHTHPFLVERTKMLDGWVDSPEHQAILAGRYDRQAAPSASGTPVVDGVKQFFEHNGSPIFIHCDNRQLGPYAAPQVQAYLRAGQVRASDLAWFEDLEGWVALEAIRFDAAK